jgi:transcription initiation factor TFIID subunit 2
MLSHDTRLRCDLVDVYYTLYGSRRPVCLPIPELAGMMNMHKQDAKKSASHAAKQLATPEVKHPPAPKDTPNPIIIDDNLECMNVEVVACDDRVKDEPMDMQIEPPRPTPKQEYFSDNSVSLPGMGQSGPVGFEPGMFKKEGDSKHKSDSGKLKKKKKDKKKHKHKHKHKHEHKHNKDKDKKEKDPSKRVKEETLSSVSSTPSPNPMSMGGESI